MIHRLSVALLALLVTTGAGAAATGCDFERVPVGAQKLGDWIDKSNWLSIESQRLSLQAGEVFMPAWRLLPNGEAKPLATKLRPVDDVSVVDPFDGRRRNLGFLLDSRLYADGLVVLRNGRVVAERYRNGMAPDQPRLLLEASRPLLNLLGAMSVSEGKLADEKSVVRYLPEMAASTGLRKISVQRLLENKEYHAWTPDEIDAWRRSGGWTTNEPDNSIRAWLSEPGRWDKTLSEREAPLFGASPDDDLLAWTLAEGNALPLSRLFCQQLLSRAKPEHAVLWLSDAQGVELASGLGLSLRDFAKLGQLLVEARSSRSGGRIPRWFVETLLASSGLRSAEIEGLAKGSEQRYGFVHLGGARNRVALIGAHGTSLYLDFDKRLVIALYATRPGENSAGTLALLEQTWKAISRAVVAPGK